MSTTKLIVLRGNSGSGKTTVAKALSKSAKDKTAHVEQDYLRRFVLGEKDLPEGLYRGLIVQVVKYCLENGYNVVLEGILSTPRNNETFNKIFEFHPDNNFIYYFDIPFEETMRRHATKPNSHEFGEKEMREWWREKDVLGIKDEQIIPADMAEEAIITKILKEANL